MAQYTRAHLGTCVAQCNMHIVLGDWQTPPDLAGASSGLLHTSTFPDFQYCICVQAWLKQEICNMVMQVTKPAAAVRAVCRPRRAVRVSWLSL